MGGCQRQQLRDYQDALQYAVWVNDKEIQSSVDYGKDEKSADGKYHLLLTMFDVGYLAPGDYQIRCLYNNRTAQARMVNLP